MNVNSLCTARTDTGLLAPHFTLRLQIKAFRTEGAWGIIQPVSLPPYKYCSEWRKCQNDHSHLGLKLRIHGVILPLHHKSSCFDAALQRDYFSYTILVKFRSLIAQTLEATNADSMLVTLQKNWQWANLRLEQIPKFSNDNLSTPL
jgi:hypothetical protein